LFRGVAAAALLGAVVAVSAPATATTMYYLDVEQLVELSDVVVTGRVVSARTFIGSSERISTAWSIEVEQVHEGAGVPQIVEVVQWGGELDGQALYVPGDARFSRGERVMVFLRQVDGAFYLTAMGQSKFTVGEPPLPTVDATIDLGAVAAPVTGRTPLPVLAVPVAALASPAPSTPVTRDLSDIAFYNRTDEPTMFGGTVEQFSYSELVERVERAATVQGAP
jgi:hypothetical protein